MQKNTAYRVFVEKKPGFQVEARMLLDELNQNLQLDIKDLHLVNVYDLFGFSEPLLKQSLFKVFAEEPTDTLSTSYNLDGKRYIAIEYLPGQFDQRASSAIDCVHLIDPTAEINIRSGKLLVFDDNVTDEDINRIKHYVINAVESREKDMNQLRDSEIASQKVVAKLDGFCDMDHNERVNFIKDWGLAMNEDDLMEVIKYFRKEKRNPTETELKILDTYWSDHCRHTTFTTKLEHIDIEPSFIKPDIEDTLCRFYSIRSTGKDLISHGSEAKEECASEPLTLMELATVGARYLRSIGKLDDLEKSEENNACSIIIDVDVDGKTEQWLLQFKNETHNHPTEIEPFGGASTCLGGAIRDPLSGRAYVYQAMRVTGAGDIWQPVSDTIPGKLPQQVISKKAAAGYSSYGNQIGLATTHVREIYHPGFVAKRLEVGAVVGAVKAADVVRERPQPGDIVLMLGGKTGRDGIGGATGSSKQHTQSSLESCGSEVQKGNAPVERALQHLFRRPEVTRLIKKSNDFGAGGVCVAIGELADGLDIWLDRVPVKYTGLNPTELAISESQERMAVVIPAEYKEQFSKYCREENIEVTHVANVTGNNRMRLYYNSELVADISREFINSAGAPHYANATVGSVTDRNPFAQSPDGKNLEDKVRSVLSLPNVTSQKGLIEMFDSTIGRSTVLMPFGGKHQLTETQVSVQKIPSKGFTETSSVMSFGYNPFISEWSPYHGAAYAVVEACAKAVAAGADYSKMRFSYQEYFERMTSALSFGKPLSALLGALKMQLDMELPSIGGKDSMSGTFEDINVPPTLIAFGVTTENANNIISPEFKKSGHYLYILKHKPLDNYMPDVERLKKNWDWLHENIKSGVVCSAYALTTGGLVEALAKSAFGNMVGAEINYPEDNLFDYSYGSILISTERELDFDGLLPIGKTIDNTSLIINGHEMPLSTLLDINTAPFNQIYPSTANHQFQGSLNPISDENDANISASFKRSNLKPHVHTDHPVVFIPVFPGTNCDYDSAKAFERAGASVRSMIFRNQTADDVAESIKEMTDAIDNCHILMIAGGFSVGDEPDGSGKFIASVLTNKQVADSINRLIERGGLILGICNGFQALIKCGLLPFGHLGEVNGNSPTLFRNDINRHISQIVTTRVARCDSPWLSAFHDGELFSIAVSHGEGKFVVSEEIARELFKNHQVAFQYADPLTGEPTMVSPYNPNGSFYAIEGIVSPNGQILGKMGHSERFEEGLFKNISGNCKQSIFENAVNYFKNN
ncbi:MAG: phosphoribosylformylglycinamidine synthase [Muribaculaceae bacterium]|nr:phosphoribosylformylglycinamidine synthase [Muribaculaceae bacterium]